MNSSSEKHSQNSIEAGDNVERTETPPVKQDSDEERRLIRKLDWRILPIASMMYLFASLDRGNLGNARLQGLPRDALHGDPTGVLFDWINSGFFFSYILFQVPATILSKLFPPRLWLGGAAIGWGICSVLMASGFNFGSLMACRLALGVFEASFGPGTVLYFSFFYTKSEVGLRLASFFGFGAVAGAFSGLIAFGIQHAHSAVAQWRLLFIIEGLPAIIMGCVALIWLPDRPEMTEFLTEDERKLAIARMNRGISGDSGLVVNKSHIVAALTDWRVYVGGVIYFGLNCSLTAMSAFLPTILKTLGYTNANAQLLTVPNYAVAAVVLVGTCWISDRQQSRGVYLFTMSVVGMVGSLLLLLVQNVHVRYFATFCVVSGTYACIGVTIAWYSHNLGSETKRAAGIPIYMGIGQCGSILGSHIFLATEGPKYIKGFAVCCALEGVVAICAVILSVSYRIENNRRDRLYGKPMLDQKVDVSELADQAPSFRYIP